MIPYIDIHTHYPPPEGVLAIQNLMNPDTASSMLEQEGLFSIGIHPRHIHPDHWLDDVETLRKLIHHPKVLAIGEAGLDGLADLPLSLQQDVFSAMVALSEESGKPLIIHAVRTHQQIALLHRNLKPAQAWIIHGFNMRQSIAQGLSSHHIFLSFGEALLHHQAPATTAAAEVPLELLFLESDDRTIAIELLYQRVASLRNMETELLKENIYHRFCKIFGYAGS